MRMRRLWKIWGSRGELPEREVQTAGGEEVPRDEWPVARGNRDANLKICHYRSGTRDQ